jgi:hypothetical protein
MVAHHFIAIEGGLRLGVQEFFDCRLVSFGSTGFQFFPWGAKAGSAHQVSHQGYIIVTHHLSSLCQSHQVL